MSRTQTPFRIRMKCKENIKWKYYICKKEKNNHTHHQHSNTHIRSYRKMSGKKTRQSLPGRACALGPRVWLASEVNSRTQLDVRTRRQTFWFVFAHFLSRMKRRKNSVFLHIFCFPCIAGTKICIEFYSG